MAAVLSGFLLALVAPGVYRTARGATGWLLALLPLGLAVYFGSHLPAIAAGEDVEYHFAWAPALQVDLSLRLDGLSLLFTLLISGIGALILVYAGGYLAGHRQLGRLYAFLLMFMASMLGLVLADNLLGLFVFWELTSISSYLLIGFDHEREQARASALQALLVTGGGGLALLAGLLLLGHAGGSFELSALVDQASQIQSHPLYLPALVLILLGCFTKSAQFPFHFWLPGAMEAPTPVSAYLHSATMVKAGIYLMARLSPALAGTDAWLWIVGGVGTITMLAGGWLALQQSDLKRLLAYSTVSALGMLTLLLGVGGEAAIYAAMVFLLGHALYKGALFQIAGTLDHETGTRNVDQLRGLARALPITAIAAAIAALSMAGLPPLLGFIAKELFYEATLPGPAAVWLTTAAVVSNMMLVAVALLVGLRPFFGKRLPTPKHPHEAPLSLWLGSTTLAGLSLVFGLWPAWGADPLVLSATAAVLGQSIDMHLALWHGWGTALALSGITLAGGIACFAMRGIFRTIGRWGNWAANWGPAGWYSLALRGLNGVASLQTRLLQSGYLRYYLMIIFAATLGLSSATLLLFVGNSELGRDLSNLRFYDVGLVVLILLAALAATLMKTRLAAIAALGVVGYGVALVFVMFGAPDVAMTQFLVETLTVIVFVLVFYHLPASSVVCGKLARLRDAAFALAMGSLMTALVLVASEVQFHPTISTYYSQHSAKEAHGRNIVNVILVDFRGLDTLGEITVLAVAGIGVYALLKLRPKNSIENTPPSVVPNASTPADVDDAAASLRETRLSIDHGEMGLNQADASSASNQGARP